VSRGLVLDTATAIAVVAVVDLDAVAVVAEVALDQPQRHAEALPDAVAAVVAGQAIAGIGVGAGPGSFIGVRTGIAFAKGLARARGVPLVGVPTLQALALSDDVEGAVVAVVDAKRGEVYAQAFVVAAGAVVSAGAPLAVRPDGVPAGGTVVGVGGAVERAGPSALGLARALSGGPRQDERATLAPVYGRAPDAKLPAVDPNRGLAALGGVLESS
jgi:tRNA threonylcarbamoyl adenosine modification protein YeaZ